MKIYALLTALICANLAFSGGMISLPAPVIISVGNTVADDFSKYVTDEDSKEQRRAKEEIVLRFVRATKRNRRYSF